MLRTSASIVLLLACAGLSSCKTNHTADAVELNDVHSRLNATLVRELAQPTSSEELSSLIHRARRDSLVVSISGGRHAMGGQQFAAGALHIDMSKMNRLLALDRARGIVTYPVAGIDRRTSAPADGRSTTLEHHSEADRR